MVQKAVRPGLWPQKAQRHREKELLAARANSVSSANHGSVGDSKGFLEEKGASLYLPLEGSPYRPLGRTRI